MESKFSDASENPENNVQTPDSAAAGNQAAGPDYALMEKCERLHFEAEMLQHNPKDGAVHLVGTPDFLLTDFFAQADIRFDLDRVMCAYAVVEDWSGKHQHLLSDLRTYKLLDDIICKDEDGNWSIQGLGLNVVLHIHYAGQRGEGYVCLHLAPWGKVGAETHLYNRITCFHQQPDAEMPVFRKFLFSFETEDPAAVLDEFQRYRESGMQKIQQGQDPEQLEAAALLQYPIPYYGELATRKMQSARWSDSLSDWTPVYHYMNQGMLMNRVPQESQGFFFDAAVNTGKCLYNKGLYTQSLYYLEQVSQLTGNPDIGKLFEECAGRTFSVRVQHDAPAYDIQVPVLGLVLRNCLDIAPTEVSRLLWFDAETRESDTLDSVHDIWEYNLWENMRDHNELTLTLSYCSRIHSDEENYADPLFTPAAEDRQTVADQSVIQLDNVIILRLAKRQGIIQLTAIVPNFRSEGNSPALPKAIALTFHERPALSKADFQQLRAAAEQKAAAQEHLNYSEMAALGQDEEAHYCFAVGQAANQQKAWGDSLYYLSQAYYRLAPKWYSEELDAYGRNLFPEICFHLGYVYMELHLPIQAYYYLSILPSVGNLHYTVELINNLCVLHDLRAMGLVHSELEALSQNKSYQEFSEEERTNYLTFLKRRKAYMLTEYHRIDEARQYLTELLDDPTCHDYAQQELDFLKKQGL